MFIFSWVAQKLPEKLASVSAVFQDYVFGEGVAFAGPLLFNKSWVFMPGCPSKFIFSRHAARRGFLRSRPHPGSGRSLPVIALFYF